MVSLNEKPGLRARKTSLNVGATGLHVLEMDHLSLPVRHKAFKFFEKLLIVIL